MQKITPFLWFHDQAEEAMLHYVSIFKNSSVDSITRFPEGTPELAGKAIVASFTHDGSAYMAMNGGPQFTINEAISFVVMCEDQAEVDYMWEKLTEGGTAVQCGWLKDKYGLSWQVVPAALMQLMGSPDHAKAQRVMEAMLKMRKIDIQTLQEAHDQK